MLDANTFKTVIENTPLVSIDLCMICNGQILLGKRSNEPLKGIWFTPGGRIHKNETWQHALLRIVEVELGLSGIAVEDFALIFDEPVNTRSNFWLNSLVCLNLDARNDLIEKANIAGIMMRPIWTPMHKLPVFEGALRGDLSNTEWFESRVINIPSSPVEVGHA